MTSTRVARRYAEALMFSAEDQGQLDRVVDDAGFLVQFLRESRDLRLFLHSPVVRKERKVEILKLIFTDRLSAAMMSFLTQLVERGREEFLSGILDQFFALHDDKQGIVNLSLQSAVDLTKKQQEAIQEKFEALTNKKIRLAVSTDPSLKGGCVARVGDTVYDSSVKRSLEVLRDQFRQGIVIT